MWQATITSASVLIISSLSSLCFAGAEEQWRPELIYQTNKSQNGMMNDTIDLVDFQRTNIKSRDLNLTTGQPWVLEIYVKRGSEFGLDGWGVLIAPKAVLIGSSCDHRRLVDNKTFVGVGNARIPVVEIIRQPKLVNNRTYYAILILSQPILQINAVPLAVHGDRFHTGSVCHTVGKNSQGHFDERIVVHGNNETRLIYTERRNCSLPGHGLDWFGMLLCPIESGSDQIVSSNYVLASVVRTSYHTDPKKCQIVYKRLGQSRRWIDEVLGNPKINAFGNPFEKADQNLPQNTNTVATPLGYNYLE